MDTQKYKELKDKAFSAKTEEEWKVVIEEIRAAVVNDQPAEEALRNYCKSLLAKKKEYWQKCAKKPQFQAKPKTMFSEETDKAIGDLARELTQLIREKRQTLII